MIYMTLLIILLSGCSTPVTACSKDVQTSKHTDGTKLCTDLVSDYMGNRESNLNKEFGEMP